MFFVGRVMRLSMVRFSPVGLGRVIDGIMGEGFVTGVTYGILFSVTNFVMSISIASYRTTCFFRIFQSAISAFSSREE